MDAQRELLDSLMGANRNGDNPDAVIHVRSPPCRAPSVAAMGVGVAVQLCRARRAASDVNSRMPACSDVHAELQRRARVPKHAV